MKLNANNMKRLAKRTLLWWTALSVCLLLGACTSSEQTETETGAAVAEKEPLRILVAGTDRASGLCDVLMLLSVREDSGESYLLQLPRDTFAIYDDGSYCKLNGAMGALGGMRALCDFLSDSFGLPIDRYVCVDLDALQRAVDAVGGVEMTLSEPMSYRDPAQGLVIDLPAGRQTLDGRAAEQFVRYRSGYGDGDLGRLEAQRQFMAAFFRTVRERADLSLLSELALLTVRYANTDLTVGELISLGKVALRTREELVCCVRLPGSVATVKASGASYFVLSRPATEALLSERFGAAPGSFDREERFCHRRNSEFSRLYGQYVPYDLVRMSEIPASGG